MKSAFKIVLFLLFPVIAFSQPTAGTTGLLNIPTAEMQLDGTFMFGCSWLPKAILPERLDYNTGNYYINITFLPFWEVNYRCTLLKVDANGTFNQDRSFAVRGRVLRERKYLPSLVVGGNDIYTSSKGGNQYFGAMYVVTSKNINSGKNRIGATLGYGFKTFRNNEITGIFGGINFSPGFFPVLKLMAEYDSKAFNAGGALTLSGHFSIIVFAYDMNYLTGCLVYKLTL